jgi:hypothetical protein
MNRALIRKTLMILAIVLVSAFALIRKQASPAIGYALVHVRTRYSARMRFVMYVASCGPLFMVSARKTCGVSLPA